MFSLMRPVAHVPWLADIEIGEAFFSLEKSVLGDFALVSSRRDDSKITKCRFFAMKKLYFQIWEAASRLTSTIREAP